MKHRDVGSYFQNAETKKKREHRVTVHTEGEKNTKEFIGKCQIKKPHYIPACKVINGINSVNVTWTNIEKKMNYYIGQN